MQPLPRVQSPAVRVAASGSSVAARALGRHQAPQPVASRRCSSSRVRCSGGTLPAANAEGGIGVGAAPLPRSDHKSASEAFSAEVSLW